MIKLQKYYETKQKEKAGGKLSERKWLKKKKQNRMGNSILPSALLKNS